MWHGVRAGVPAALATLAATSVASFAFGVQPPTEALQQPLLEVLPGPLFGFLIDHLQHLGKVIEEAGILAAVLVSLVALGGGYGWLRSRLQEHRYAAWLSGAALWLLLLLVAPLLAGGQPGIPRPLLFGLWGMLSLLYALLLQLCYEAGGQREEVDQSRRRILARLPVTVAALGLGVLGLSLVPKWYRSAALAPETGITGVSPELTPVQNFYIVSKNFTDPAIPLDRWALRVRGLVEEQLELSYGQLRALPAVTEYATLACISNNVGGKLMSTAAFRGVPLRELIALARPRAAAAAVSFKARDGYSEFLPLDLVSATPEVLIAYDLNGQPLPPNHGFPARVLVPGHYGMKGPKWLEEIELTGSEQGGFFEAEGWDPQAIVRTTARFDTPGNGYIVSLAPVELAGVAYAGTRGVSAVEVSSDGGRTWRPARLQPPLSSLTWVLWKTIWAPPGGGSYTLQVRARDGRGDLQTDRVQASFPSGATGYHTIEVNVVP